jgi:hypothetical protein
MSGGELGERKSRECGSTQMLISIWFSYKYLKVDIRIIRS